MKKYILRILFLATLIPVLINGAPLESSEINLTFVTEDQKNSYKNILESQCELSRERWENDEMAEGSNHSLFLLELEKRVFANLQTLNGDCRTISNGGVPTSLISRENETSRSSGWIGIDLKWLTPEETLLSFSSFVFDYTYEKRMRTPWNYYFNKVFKKISAPLTCSKITEKFIEENSSTLFPIDVRANTKIFLLNKNNLALLAEDTQNYRDNFYPLTLIGEEEDLVVGVNFAPIASFDWATNEIMYKNMPAVLKHFLEFKLELYPVDKKLIFVDPENIFKLDNYVIANVGAPKEKDHISCGNYK